jgi:hypothetical protein
MFTADQFVAHLVGDYVLQSDWMANEKSKRNLPAIVHVIVYSLPFLFINQSPLAMTLIAASHFVMDRWRLARYIVWVKNIPWQPWAECTKTGHLDSRPPWLAGWLLIIVDNTVHIICNGLVIHYFG